MKINKTKLKNIINIIIYWTALSIIFIFANFLKNEEKTYTLASALSIFLLFISPFCFLIPYRLIKEENIKSKLIYLLFGLIIPFSIIYFLFYLNVKNNFYPKF